MPLSEPGLTAGDFNGPLVVTPAPTDRFVVRQADDVVRVETRLQIYTAEAGEVFLADAGLVGAPGIARNGDPNTGVFFPALDQMAFTAGGVEGARIEETAGVVQFIVPLQNLEGTPSIAFGDGDTGFFEPVDDQINITVNGNTTFFFNTGSFVGNAALGVQIVNENVSDTNPVYVFRSDTDTGLGRRTADIGVLIAGGVNIMEFGEAAAAPLMGFYGTAAIVLQTGVAVTSAGIHAALVNLGLITA